MSILPKVIMVSIFFSAIHLASCSRINNNSKLNVLAPAYEPVSIPASQALCSDNILSSLKQSNVFNIAIALGYLDTVDEGLNHVGSHTTLSKLHELLTNKCKYQNQGFCEFTKITGENEKNIIKYQRNLFVKGKSITVNVSIANGVYSDNHDNNKTIYATQQKEQTKIAQDFFLNAFATFDAVFYSGHSRDGGGPDFDIPHVTSKGGVDYAWYHKNKPGLNNMLKAIAKAKTKPAFSGMFSCDSKDHFAEILSKKMPKTKFVFSLKVVPIYDVRKALYRTLESVLNFECPNTLKNRLADLNFTPYPIPR